MKILLLTIFICTLVACAATENKESFPEQKEFITPVDWKRINERSIEFYIPPELSEKIKSSPMFEGSGAKFYGNENIWLVFTIQSKPPTDWNEFSKERDFQFEKTIVDGKQAVISTFTGADMVNDAEGKNCVAVFDVPEIRGKEKNSCNVGI